MFKCPNCGKTFESLEEVFHITTRSGTKIIRCKNCLRCFKLKSNGSIESIGWPIFDEKGKYDWKKIKKIEDKMIQELDRGRRGKKACFYPGFEDFNCPYGLMCSRVYSLLEAIDWHSPSLPDSWNKFRAIYCPKKEEIDKTLTCKCIRCGRTIYPREPRFEFGQGYLCIECFQF